MEQHYLISKPAESTFRQVMRISFAIFLTILTAGYLLPTTIALIRRRDNRMAIFLVNFLLGWTLLGWVITLAWSVTSDSAERRVVKVAVLD